MKRELKFVIVLAGVTLLAGGLLSWVYKITNPIIEDHKRKKVETTLRELLPEAYRFEEKEPKTLWIGYNKNEEMVGIVFKVAPRGYGGPIETMVGVGMDKKIKGIKIASPAEGLRETPGLGTRILEDWFQNQFIGKKKEAIALKKEGGELKGITGATISAKAVIDGVRKGMEKYISIIEAKELLIQKVLEEVKKEFEIKEELKKIAERVWEIPKKGWVIIATTQGYVDSFFVAAILDTAKTIEKVFVPITNFKETPQFGEKCREKDFLSQFKGIKDTLELRKIDTVTGATITSKAVINGVKKILKKLKD